MGAPDVVTRDIDEEARRLGFDTDEAADPPMPEGFTLISPTEDPLAAAGAIAEAFHGGEQEATEERAADNPPPLPDEITGDDAVNLLAGYVDSEGHIHRAARTRELTGEDEEVLSRALNSENRARYIEVLLERGVVSIGDYRIKDHPGIIDKLLLGDRDLLVLSIRRMTYGDTMDIEINCMCGTTSKVRLDLPTDVPFRSLPWDAGKEWHEVPMFRGGFATVRLGNGTDQRECFSLPDTATLAEVNTLLLSRVVKDYNGVPVNGSLQAARGIGLKDRKTIQDWLVDNQPGPQYEDMKHVCTVCSKEVPLGLSAADMFPV